MVKIEFEDAIQPNDFEAVDGVSDVSVSDHTLTCYVTGSVDSLIKAASKHTVNRIESAQPGLEEVFLAYYSDEGNVQEASDA
jgi:ABC-2 type transport system ATP-binding protein